MSSSPPTTPDVPTVVDPTPDPVALQTAIINLFGPMIATVTGKSGSRKRLRGDDSKKENTDPSTSDSQNYKAFGQMIGQQLDIADSIDAMVNTGITHDAKDSDSDDDAEHALSAREERLLYGWKSLCTCIPGFQKHMLGLSTITDGTLGVRLDDQNSLKLSIVSYLLVDHESVISPTIAAKQKLKNDRSFYHLVTARLLCPLKYPATPETYASLKARSLPLTAALLPCFLYPEDHIYDPEDISKNVLHGHIMTRSAKHIFQGPSTALDAPGSHRGKQGNAALSGLSSMTPHTIAYVAVQAHFALSSTSSWAPLDGLFSYQEFYWQIVRLFEDDIEGPELIKFYNHHVFGTDTELDCTAAAAVLPVEDDYEILKQQWAAKRACMGNL